MSAYCDTTSAQVAPEAQLQKIDLSNANMEKTDIRKYCKINKEGESLIKTAMDKLGLSARAYDRILKVSRTIADMEKSESISSQHLSEAIQYRSLDRSGWMG